ncbi:MAG: proton-conducting transporter membrane subunit [Acidianus infernus]|nr:proton-conducting transporter membrane subunit [Acidianus infernus]
MFTAIFTSLNALVSKEQKVILANSTADQISLMILSSSLGGLLAIQLHNFALVYAGISIGLIQMIAHGIYKATLFMNAGSVIHYIESRYIGEYPNLYKKLKLVFVLQLFAALNLANVPLFIGFWAHSFISYLTSYNSYIDMIYIVLEFAGAIYIIRYIARLFMYGSGDKEAEGHISPIMYVSPAILVISSIILSIEIFPFVSFIRKGFSVPPNVFIYNNIDFIVSLVGIAIAFIIYTGGMFNNKFLSPIINFFYYGWYIYPIMDIAGILSLKVSSGIFNYVETKGIDNSLNYKLPNGIINYGGRLFNILQKGLLRDYLGYYVGGIILLIVIVIILMLGD